MEADQILDLLLPIVVSMSTSIKDSSNICQHCGHVLILLENLVIRLEGALSELSKASATGLSEIMLFPEASKYLRTDPGTLRDRVRMKQIRYIKDGRRLKFLKSDLDAYLRANSQEPRRRRAI